MRKKKNVKYSIINIFIIFQFYFFTVLILLVFAAVVTTAATSAVVKEINNNKIIKQWINSCESFKRQHKQIKRIEELLFDYQEEAKKNRFIDISVTLS